MTALPPRDPPSPPPRSTGLRARSRRCGSGVGTAGKGHAMTTEELPFELPGRPRGGDFDHGSLTFIGTATVLIRYGGFTILTDPNFLHRGQSAKLGYGLRSRRLTEPALSIPELPPLDVVLLSHHHGDHFDEVAAAGLDHALPVVTTPH